ncbi:MAG: Single-stranded-DNA-specific exonuclease RecJ [Pseudomonadales bacterium]|nr:Single-stranded-DNA-specific exonuclease RecJ [Pseudomonadales bacterium]
MRRAIRRRTADAAIAGIDDPLLARIYAARGVQDAADVDRGLGRLWPPDALPGVDAAARRLADALYAHERIVVVGDYDADGATSSALALRALRALGAADCDFLVPNRFEHGYGLSPELVEIAATLAPGLILTVDNGIAAHEGVAAAARLGIDVVVTDHHLPGDTLPAACAIVNPNLGGSTFPSRALAGVGVVFYLMGAVRAELRARGWFAQTGRAEPNLADFLDLVALGTVADVVALDGNNRALVHQGLLRIRAGRGCPGIRALIELAGRDPARAGSAELGFVAGPRINAAGRLDDIGLGIRCLLEDDHARARVMAAELDRLNRERREIEDGMQREALGLIAEVAADGQELPWGVCLHHDGWHQGVVGLVASRVRERTHRPVIAFAPGNPGELKGSGRSIPGLHIRDAIAAVATAAPQLVSRFGGHATAAGLTIGAAHFDAFAQAFDREVRRRLRVEDLEHVLESDGELDAHDFSLERAEQLRDAGPWGQHFPEPVFDGEFVIAAQRIVGGRHLKLRVAPCTDPARGVDAIAFNVDLARWPDPQARRVRLAYRLDVNVWRDTRSLQLVVEDLQPIGAQ